MYEVIYEIVRNGIPFNLEYTEEGEAEETATELAKVDSRSLYEVHKVYL